MPRKTVIVGAVAGGPTAAARLRRLSDSDEIVLLDRGEYISFATCGLPYHIGGTAQDHLVSALQRQTVEGIGALYGVDARVRSLVTAIDLPGKSVAVTNLETGEHYQESYDSLILSTGARARVPEIAGLDRADNYFTLRSIPDLDKISKFIAEHEVQHATILGGGFIGMEVMDRLVALGLQVRVIEITNQVLPSIDYEMAQIVHAQLSLHNVELITGETITAVADSGRELTLTNGETLTTDLLVIATGVRPNAELAAAAGLEIGATGGIRVDAQLRTSAPDVYAIGDAIEVVQPVDGSRALIPKAWPANRQGRLVADVINGLDVSYPGTQRTVAAKVFELTVASTGLTETALRLNRVRHHTIHIHPTNRAPYQSDSAPLALKLLFTDEGKILGAQAIGTDLVEKRIDVISTAMHFGATATELAGIELGYAPQFSSAKDPVNMLGYVADDVLSGMVETIQWYDVDELLDSGAYFLDVREDYELETGVFWAAMHIPLSELRTRSSELPIDQPIFVFCQVGQRAYIAARILSQRGYEVYNLDGGYLTYRQATFDPGEFVPRADQSPQPAQPIAAPAPEPTPGVPPPIELDVAGAQCPGPLLAVRQAMHGMVEGQRLNIRATDFGLISDLKAWCLNTGNTLISAEVQDSLVVAALLKGAGQADTGTGQAATDTETAQIVQLRPAGLPEGGATVLEGKAGTTMVVFSGDLDKALAAMIIASGAAAFGKPVTIFFTFWGLSVIKKSKVRKRGMAKMFDTMLPSGPDSLSISKMNMGGMGTTMIKGLMRQKNVDSLPDMIDKAHQLGVKFVACTMSMDLMGFQREEFYDFVEFGGVATFLGDSETANMQLFI